MAQEAGTFLGDVCNRRGCAGVIEETAKGDCSCHLSPPCGSCTTPREYCPKCDWSAAEEDVAHWASITKAAPVTAYERPKQRELDPTRLDYRSGADMGRDGLASTCSMIKEGVYPETMTREEVEHEVRGTFGGSFVYFGGGKFKYRAYTD